MIPQHVSIIMDGNGRWAKARGLPRVEGHKKGVEVVKDVVQLFAERGVKYLTLFAFSTENWNRPVAEINLLFDLLTRTLRTETQKLHESGVKLNFIGDLQALSRSLREVIDNAEKLTADNQAINLTIAVNYGGRWDIVQACKGLAQKVENGQIKSSEVTQAVLQSHLSTADLPEPDLFIRTGSEQRISNFLLWQLAYTELFFTDTYWPDFSKDTIDQSLAEFAKRQRRFGMTSEQVEKDKG